MSFSFRQAAIVVALGLAAVGCTNRPQTVLERHSEARSLASDLLVQFTSAADAGNRAVMADSDQTSSAFAREAEEAAQAVQKDVDALRALLGELRYSTDAALLEEFGRRFGEYRTLDKDILGLAVENTNLKAQRLSFGAAQQSVDELRNALDAIQSSVQTKDRWRVEALVATAVAEVRAIQVLQSPHIAEADEAAMSRMEKQMATSEAAARRALESLANVTPSQLTPKLAAATAALDRFMGVNTEIVVLSRRNSGVRSLALSLGQKRMLTAKCDETLHALRDSLARPAFAGTK